MEISDNILIDQVFQYEFLYNKMHILHRNKIAVKSAWKAIAEECNCPEEIVKKRWAYLRVYFVKIFKEKKSKINEDSSHPKIKWPLYQQMSFLEPYVNPNINEGISDIPNYMNNDSYREEYYSNRESYRAYNFNDTDNAEHIVTEPELPYQISSVSETNIKDERINNDDNLYENLSVINSKRKYENYSQSENNIVSSSNNEQFDEDSDEVFFYSLQPALKKMNTNQKLKFRIRVMEIIRDSLNDD